MSNNPINPMSAFVGVDFDCQFSNDFECSRIDTGHLKKIEGSKKFPQYWLLDEFNSISGLSKCRPRLNKAQVLEDYTPILVDGFVWGVSFSYCFDDKEGAKLGTDLMPSGRLKSFADEMPVASVAFKGIQQGYGLSEWAKANNVPIFNSDMEVVLW